MAAESLAGEQERRAPQTRLQELTALVTEAAALFYLVEEGVNPQVRSYWDAFHYIATSVSVGYAQIFPVTEMGKAIGGVVMMLGPAMTAKALDGREDGEAGAALVGRKLDEAVAELRLLSAALTSR